MAKKITGYIKLQIGAGKANPSPPIGPALGQKGVNIMEFCKAFNASTANFEVGVPTPTVITVYGDRSFSFIVTTPPTSYLIKKAANVNKGSSETGKKDKIATIKMSQVKEIADIKMKDLNANDIAAACSMIVGTARSMGIDVIEDSVRG